MPNNLYVMKLKKELGFLDVFCISAGAMISSGIFILPGLAFAKTGPSVFIAYFLAGILALIGILSTIELATAMPKAGGDYFFIGRSLGPLIGSISAIFSWLALSLKSAFAIFGIGEIIFLLTGIDIRISSAIICVLFVLLNIIGVKESARFQIILVTGLFLIMGLYIVPGLFEIRTENFTPFMPKGINAILATTGFIFVSFGGLLNVASMAEEIDNPAKNIPLGIICSLLCVTLFYTLMLIVTVGILPADEFTNSLTPIALSANKFIGKTGYIAISIAAALAFITTANAGIMSASRYPLAMSKDNLLPQFIGIISQRFKTPAIAIIITGLFIQGALILPLEMLVKTASTVILVSYILTNVSVIILRESKLKHYKPTFHTPLYPWIQIFNILIFSFFVIDLGLSAVEITLSFLVFAIIIYFLYGKYRAKREYALIYLMKRITKNVFTEHLLETELREILYDRANIIPDGFDELVQNSAVLDIEKHMRFEELFGKISKIIAGEICQTEQEIYQLLINRQKESDTAITDFVAIPHIITENNDRCYLLLIRAKKGIRFSDENNSVKAIFVFVGTKENRTFHLRILAAIATLIQQKDFEYNWLSAENANYLKDIILLSERKRFPIL